MGGQSSSTQNQTTTQRTTPYEPAAGALQGILSNVGGINPNLTGAETTALNNLSGVAGAGNQFAPQIGNVATGLLGGGPDRTGVAQDAYNRYIQQTMPTAQGQYLDPNTNPFYGQTTAGISDQVRQQIQAAFSGSGRDPTGAGNFGGMLGESIARGLAPTYANQWNQERGNQMNAWTGQFGAGQGTAGLLANLDKQAANTQLAGITAADAANTAQSWGPMQMLQIEAQRRGIPLQTLAAQMGITLPAAQAFGQTTGTGQTQGTQQMSGAQQFATIMQGIGAMGSFFPKAPTPVSIV